MKVSAFGSAKTLVLTAALLLKALYATRIMGIMYTTQITANATLNAVFSS